MNYEQLTSSIKHWGLSLGFQQVGITDIDLSTAEGHFIAWLKQGWHGDMNYMAKHGSKRTRPKELLPGTLRVISARMDYLSAPMDRKAALQCSEKAYIARYALGRDYHKVLRNRLQELAKRITSAINEHHYRVFVDSGPVLEKPLAQKAGLGWQGKHTLLINRDAGSWFFLGMIYTNLPLPVDQPETNDCGNCQACINGCPTNAIQAPCQLDARRCIAYLTIEYKGSIPVELRSKIGNRIFGCDDCQLICPWNRYASLTQENDFKPREHFSAAHLVDLFLWTEEEFLAKMEGSPIRRITYEMWLRNIAIALGNAPSSQEVIKALKSREHHPSALVREHVAWALH